MATIIKRFDTLITVYHKVGRGTLVGIDSIFGDTPHPSTGNRITGFQYDKATWKSEEAFNTAHVIPTLWDPSEMEEDYFQSGIGDEQDLEVQKIQSHEINDQSVWLPTINHGYYYDLNDEHYLFSDDSHIDYVSISGVTTSGTNYKQLTYQPKAGIPIIARQYRWDTTTNKYKTDIDISKVINFTGLLDENNQELITVLPPNNILWSNVNTLHTEFLIDVNTEPPTAYFNKQYCDPVGEERLSTTGMSSADLLDLQYVGVTTGEANQELHLKYSPVDSTKPVQVVLELGGQDFELWSGVNQLTSGVLGQFLVDYDLGIIRFGDEIFGGLPSLGYSAYATYTKSLSIEYEPEFTRDIIENSQADINPIRRYTDTGFVFLKSANSDVSSITLEADLIEQTTDMFGPLYMGNDFATVIATVYGPNGETIEGETVTFEIVSREIGGFTTEGSVVSAVTDNNGQAQTLYNAPRTIESMGAATDTVTVSGSTSNIFVEDFEPQSSESSLFLFQVAKEDAILGIPESELLSFYEDYLDELGIPVATGVNVNVGPVLKTEIDSLGSYSWIAGARAEQIRWEILHRYVHNLATPKTYEEEDLITGKKTIVAVMDSDAVNPYTGTTPAMTPLQPDSFEVTSSGTRVYFDQVLPAINGGSDHKSYLIIGPVKVELRAYAYNERLNTTIYSNTITLLIDIAPAMKGLIDIDTVNSVPSGLLLNADYYDQNSFDMSPVTLTDTGVLPLGFRIRSSGITLASALDGITFINLNPELQFVSTPVLGHEFRVQL